MMIGTTTKMISKASSTKAQMPSTPSTTATAATSPPGIPATKLFTRASVPSRRATSVNVVAAIRSENKAPVMASASCSTSRKADPRRWPVISQLLSKAPPPLTPDGVEIPGHDATEQYDQGDNANDGEHDLLRARPPASRFRYCLVASDIPSKGETQQKENRCRRKRSMEHVLRVDHTVAAT